MKRGTVGKRATVIVAALIVGIGSLGCGGHGGGGGPPVVTGAVIAVSYAGYPLVPGGPIPRTYRNEAIRLRFSAPLDDGIFGGFVMSASGSPRVFEGRSAFGSVAVPYFAYADQAAARAAVAVFDDRTGNVLSTLVLGRKTDDPTVLVIDPVVDVDNPFNLAGTTGFSANTQCDIRIPGGSALSAGGRPVQAFGAAPPVSVPGYTTSPAVPVAFFTGATWTADATPPSVVEITTLSVVGGSPEGSPIPASDVFRIRFSEAIDPASIRLHENITVKSVSLVSSLDPTGTIVPVSMNTSGDGRTLWLTPMFGLGPDVSSIVVEVLRPVNPADGLFDLPSGPAGNRNPLVAGLTRTFTTIATPAAPAVGAILETFSSSVARDLAFAGRYHDAIWNAAAGRLEAPAISGTAATGGPLGSRVQYTINPTTPAPVTPLWAPFGDTTISLLPGGAILPFNFTTGLHSQFLYAAGAGELAEDLADTCELVEWGAMISIGVPFPATYPSLSLRMSHTTADPRPTSAFGLLSVFTANHDFDNPQNDWILPTVHPGGLPLNEAPVLVLPTQPYVVPTFATAFVPFPRLTTPFDFDDNRTEISILTNIATEPNLLLDFEVGPTPTPTGNYLQTNFPTLPVPVRLQAGISSAAGGGPLAFSTRSNTGHMRFTFVGRNSSARTTFFDLGPGGAVNLGPPTLSPTAAGLPPGTVVTVRAQAADAILGGAPSGGTGTPNLTIVDRYGVVRPDGLAALAGRRYVRFSFEFEADLPSNAVPFIDTFAIGWAKP